VRGPKHFASFGLEQRASAATRITWCTIRSFLVEAPPRNASAGASVEKIFDLGKTDTAPPFAVSIADVEHDFHRAREIRIEYATCVKTSIP